MNTPSMKTILIALTFCFIVGCSTSDNSSTSLSDFIPESATIVLNIKDIEAFKSDIKNSDFISQLTSVDQLNKRKSQLSILTDLKTNNEILFCLSPNKDTLNYTFITKLTDSLFGKKSLDSLDLYYTIKDSIFIASNFKGNTEIKSTINKDRDEIPGYTIPEDNSYSVTVNQKDSKLLHALYNLDSTYNSSTDLQLKSQITPDYTQFNGIVKSNNNMFSLPKLFENTKPLENSIQHIVPVDSKGFTSITFNDFNVLYDNIQSFNKTTADTLQNITVFQTLNEIGEIYYSNETLVVLKSIDAFTTKDALIAYQDVVDQFRNVDIFRFTEPTLFRSILSPLVSAVGFTHYIILDDYFVFGASTASLTSLITHYKNQTTIGNSDAFIASKEYLSDASSLLVALNPEKLKERFGHMLQTDLMNMQLDDYVMSAFQLVQDDGFAHFNGIINKVKAKSASSTISEEFNVVLDEDILMAPHFIINHRTGQKDIVVQDINNSLYLISNSGKVLWKKRLSGPILGKMHQVDLYKNGRLQMAFATPNRVYVLDRNGQDVTPFPLKFNDEITQPLSVFDYDNRRNYRFLVTQGKSLLMYDKAGKSVRGFRYKGNEHLNNQPQHFRVGSKDYIVFTAENTMKILNRKGQIRVRMNQQIPFSERAVFLYNNQFTTTTKGGNIVKISTGGTISEEPLNLLADHSIDATSKTMVTLSENELRIRQKKIDLDFGNYTQPKIFYLNDKIYVSVTDQQTQKIHLFDSQARPIPNFPVYGSSTIDMDNMDKDTKLEFVSIGEENAIVVYKKNIP